MSANHANTGTKTLSPFIDSSILTAVMFCSRLIYILPVAFLIYKHIKRYLVDTLLYDSQIFVIGWLLGAADVNRLNLITFL